ncbi:MAG TPA: P22 phage major capsid protein family protein [Candidatus Paceibacterota bacterium]
MANSILTIDMITRKTLEILENNLVVTRNVNREYDSSFAQEGAKIGTTLRVRLPDRALVTDGAALSVQDDNEQYTTVTVSSQKHIGVNFTTAEMTMQLDDFAERVLKPRVSQLAASVDAQVVSDAYKGIYQSVGTPGTTPATSLVLLQGHQKLSEMATPLSPRYATVNPAANANLVEGMKGLFNPTDTVSRQFKSGLMGEGVLGYDEINMSQSIASHTTGDWGTTITSTGTLSTQGQATLPISFTGSSKTWKIGDVFTIANVYSVNPQTRQSTGSLQQFVVTADLTASSTGTLSISPAIYTSSHALATVDSFPQASAAITMLGSAATVYPQNLIYHRDAITFATADLVMPKQGVVMASRQVHNGISLRIVQAYDINNDRMPTRIDVLFGSSVIRAPMACRLWG